MLTYALPSGAAPCLALARFGGSSVCLCVLASRIFNIVSCVGALAALVRNFSSTCRFEHELTRVVCLLFVQGNGGSGDGSQICALWCVLVVPTIVFEVRVCTVLASRLLSSIFRPAHGCSRGIVLLFCAICVFVCAQIMISIFYVSHSPRCLLIAARRCSCLLPPAVLLAGLVLRFAVCCLLVVVWVPFAHSRAVLCCLLGLLLAD